MDKNRKPHLAIPMERTVKKERPGRWMPVVWLLFAVALTVGIIAAVQTFVPINPTDRANASVSQPEKSAKVIALATPAPSAPLETAPAPEPKVKETSQPATPAPSAVIVATEPVTIPSAPPPSPSPTAAPEPGIRLAKGDEATLTVRTQAAWREGGRSSGQTYLPPGTKVVVVQVLPDRKYVVHWREAEAEVPAASLAPITP